MHDGDQKMITVAGNKLTITPHGNNQTWVVNAVLDRAHCRVNVDFNVPNKPSPPPVNLTATFYEGQGKESELGMAVFTDPSGTLAKPDFPLNTWILLTGEARHLLV